MPAKTLDDVRAAAAQYQEDDPNEDEMPTPEEMAVSANAIVKGLLQVDKAEASGRLSHEDADLMRGRINAFKQQYRHELHRQNDGMKGPQMPASPKGQFPAEPPYIPEGVKPPPVTQADINSAVPPDERNGQFHPPMAPWHPPMSPGYNPYFNNPANKGRP